MARRIVTLGLRPVSTSEANKRAPRVIEAFDPSKVEIKATSLTPEENYQASKVEIGEAFQTVGNAYLDKGISHATSKDVRAAMLGILCPGERTDARLWERTVDAYFKAENVLARNANGTTTGRGGGIYFVAEDEPAPASAPTMSLANDSGNLAPTAKPSKPGKASK